MAVSSHNGEASCELLYSVYLYLTLPWLSMPSEQWSWSNVMNQRQRSVGSKWKQKNEQTGPIAVLSLLTRSLISDINQPASQPVELKQSCVTCQLTWDQHLHSNHTPATTLTSTHPRLLHNLHTTQPTLSLGLSCNIKIYRLFSVLHTTTNKSGS